MFSQLVSARFHFLERDYGFERIDASDRCVMYRKGGPVICFSHSPYDEVSLSLRRHIRGSGFSPNFLISLTDARKASAYSEKMVSKPEQIDAALAEQESILRTYGQRLLDGDTTIFGEMEAVSKAALLNDRVRSIRHHAEEAFAAKDYRKAFREYQELGAQRSLFDTKRMEMCERHLSEAGG